MTQDALSKADQGALDRAARATGPAAFCYALTLFASSAGGLVIEIVAGRMIAPYVGMSLYTWTAVIAVVLAGFALGHWIGGQLAQGDGPTGHRRVAWLAALAALSVVACLPLIRLIAPAVLATGLHPIPAIVLLTSGLFLLPSLFVGAISPILTKLAVERRPAAMGRIIGRMFAAGALGSIAGTLAAGYLFIAWIGSIGTLLAVAACYLAIALGFALAARAGRRRLGLAMAGSLAILLGVALLGERLQAFTGPCLEESDYYCIQVVDISDEIGRPSAVMVLDHLGHGINDRDDPTVLHSSYLQLTDRLLEERLGSAVLERGRFAAFFIGGGANSLPRAWAARYPAATLVVSEVDPAVTRVAREALWFAPGPNLRLDHRDGRVALQDSADRRLYDVIVGDAFHDISVPQHLTTREFAALVARRLAPDGFYVLNVVDSGRRPRFLYSVVRTLATVFAQVEVWVDAEQRGSGHLTYLLVAGRDPTGQERLRAAASDGPLWLRWPDENLARRIADAEVPLLTDDFAPVDRLMLPVLAADP